MHTFKDNEGREWQLRLTIGVAQRVLDACGVNLLEPERSTTPGDPPLLTKLGTDEFLMARVIAAMLAKQMEAADLDADDVFEAFDGDVTLQIQNAFYAELQDFFRKRGRAERAKAVASQAALIEKGITKAMKKIDALDQDKEIDKAFMETAGETSGDSPEASVSTPDP